MMEVVLEGSGGRLVEDLHGPIKVNHTLLQQPKFAQIARGDCVG
jgi:hypothetical protein